MDFFKQTEKWTCKEVCDYYWSKSSNKEKSLGEILCEIRKDLVANLSDPNLYEQTSEILNKWNVSIEVVS